MSIVQGDEHIPLSPRARCVGTAARSTSTTLEWVGRSLTAGGGAVAFEFGLSPVRGPDDARAVVSSQDVTVVVQMIPR